MIENLKSRARRMLRTIGVRFPGLQRYAGHLGVGRLLASAGDQEILLIDDDVKIMLDFCVSNYRYLYYHHDMSKSPEVALIRRLLREGSIFVDVGAHMGMFSLVAAKYASRVFAFEISPTTCHHFRQNLNLNPDLAGKIDLRILGLADFSGRTHLYSSADQPDLASLRPIQAAHEFEEDVEVSTLDEQLAGVDTTFLKIDVEGAELQVLRGAQQHLQCWKPLVFVELFELYQQRFGSSCADIKTFMADRGYEGYLVETTQTGELVLSPLDLTRLNTAHANNGLFVAKDRQEEILARLR